MVVALASTVVVARRSNVRKSPVRVTVGLENVWFMSWYMWYFSGTSPPEESFHNLKLRKKLLISGVKLKTFEKHKRWILTAMEID